MDELEDIRGLGEYDTLWFKTGSAVLSGFCLGAVTGAVAATWSDVPAIERNQALPALRKTGKVMLGYGTYFAAVGGAYALADAAAQDIRGKKDIWNGVLGGLAAGAVIGVRAGNMPVGVGAAAALAAVSALVDISGQVTKTPTDREYLPFSREQGAAPAPKA